MSNYPLGSEDDPNAPWNQEETKECEECHGDGWNWAEEQEYFGQKIKCDVCDGKGEIEIDDD